MDKEVLNNIKEQCEEQYIYYGRLNEYINEVIIDTLNNKIQIKKSKDVKAVMILFGQATRIFRASTILVYQGYQDNAIILIRSLVEATISIGYIIQEDQDGRASKYFENGIKNVNIRKRAEYSKNKQLYKEYKELCNQTHNNYSAISKNIMGNKFNLSETSDNAEFVAIFINACYSYLICTIHEYCDLGTQKILNFGMPKNVLKLVGDFYYSKDPLISTIIKAKIEYIDKLF